MSHVMAAWSAPAWRSSLLTPWRKPSGSDTPDAIDVLGFCLKSVQDLIVLLLGVQNSGRRMGWWGWKCAGGYCSATKYPSHQSNRVGCQGELRYHQIISDTLLI